VIIGFVAAGNVGHPGHPFHAGIPATSAVTSVCRVSRAGRDRVFVILLQPPRRMRGFDDCRGRIGRTARDGSDEAAPAAPRYRSAWAAADPHSTGTAAALRDRGFRATQARSVEMSRSSASSRPARTGFQSYIVPASGHRGGRAPARNGCGAPSRISRSRSAGGLMLVIKDPPGSAHAIARPWIDALAGVLAASPGDDTVFAPLPTDVDATHPRPLLQLGSWRLAPAIPRSVS